MTEAKKTVNRLRYLVPIALVAIAIGVRVLALGVLGTRVAWLTFSPAVAIASIIGGLYTGLLATILSILAVIFWSLTNEPFIKDLGDWMGVIVFFTNGIVISAMAQVMHKSRQRAIDAKKRQDRIEIYLKRENQFNHLIVENVTDGLSVSHAVEKHPYIIFTVWNHHMTEITGYTIGEINRIGWYNSLFPDPQQLKRIVERVDAVRAGDNLVDEIWEIVSKDGEKKLISISTALIRMDDDGLLHVLALMQDITQKKKAENDLIRASAVIQQSPITVLITDTNGDIEYVNTKFTDVTGYQLNEVIGKNPRILKSGKTPAEVYAKLRSDITAGKQWQGELCNRIKNGTEIWEVVKVLPLRDSDGKVTHYVRLSEDITDLRRIELEPKSTIKIMGKECNVSLYNGF
ncbi:MAG: PAS domain S-box protein [Nitrospirae bacterium]|nr:PAS domain S-box protein [Nitrospirota bacterium]